MGKSHIALLNPENINCSSLKMCEGNGPKTYSSGQSKGNFHKQKDSDDFPPGIVSLSNQVAGHMKNGKSCGMLQYEGKVLKPILNQVNGQTEMEFYEELNKTNDDLLMSLKDFVPKYFGTINLNIHKSEVKFIVIEDVTRFFKEACIMDIKIGRRTWDPLATKEKIIKEDKKYQDTKRDLGISIPGFLVHKISNGRLCRYGKEYGKKLNSETIKDALRIFLNADSVLSRELLLRFLVDLWRILHWARKQSRIRLFSSSLLLIYDARYLRQYVSEDNNNATKKVSRPACNKTAHLYKPISIMKLNDDCVCTGFSGQFTKDGPILKSTTCPKLASFATTTPKATNANHPWEKDLRDTKLKRVHSFQNNYDKDLQKLKSNYMYMLDDLVDDQRNENWAMVKMIDFAHVFPSEHNEIDRNYLEGIENLIKLLEGFLSDTFDT